MLRCVRVNGDTGPPPDSPKYDLQILDWREYRSPYVLLHSWRIVRSLHWTAWQPDHLSWGSIQQIRVRSWICFDAVRMRGMAYCDGWADFLDLIVNVRGCGRKADVHQQCPCCSPHYGTGERWITDVYSYKTYFSWPKTMPGSAAVRPSYMCRSLKIRWWTYNTEWNYGCMAHLPQIHEVVTAE